MCRSAFAGSVWSTPQTWKVEDKVQAHQHDKQHKGDAKEPVAIFDILTRDLQFHQQ